MVVTKPGSACSWPGRPRNTQLSWATETHPPFHRTTMSKKPTHCSMGVVATKLSSQKKGVTLGKDSSFELVTYPHRKCILASFYSFCASPLHSTTIYGTTEWCTRPQSVTPHCQYSVAKGSFPGIPADASSNAGFDATGLINPRPGQLSSLTTEGSFKATHKNSRFLSFTATGPDRAQKN